VLKATIVSTLALAATLSLSGCGGKSKDAAPAAEPAAPTTAAPATMPENHPMAQPGADVDVTGVAKAEGGKTVAEVYAEKDALANQQVTVRGKVVKANPNVMNMNWLHVRDGSGVEGTNDLTVTSVSTPTPKVGDTVLVTGTVTLNRDIGMNYQYPVLIEKAEVKIESASSEED
jgi:hypothetical protein